MSPWLVAIGGIMQNFLEQFDEGDRRVVRKWRLATLCFYGSILAGVALYAALHWTPEVSYAAVDSAAHAKLAGAPGGDRRVPFAP